ncbi:MAG: RDD family protein [Myxococcota bacterium]
MSRIRRDARQRTWLGQSTPENVEVQFALADPASRLLAFFIDTILQALLTLASGLGLGLLFGELGIAAGLVLSFVIRTFYFAGAELAFHGASPGKRFMGLVVVSRDGGPLTAEMLLARNFTREPELFLPLSALAAPQLLFGDEVGLIPILALIAWTLFLILFPMGHPEGARIGDLLAGTVVVNRPKAVLRPDLVDRADAGFTFTKEQLDLYGIRELQVLETILRDRIDDVDLLEDVASRIAKKLGLKEPPKPVRPFLGAFYAAQRGRLEQHLVMGERRERKVE